MAVERDDELVRDLVSDGIARTAAPQHDDTLGEKEYVDDELHTSSLPDMELAAFGAITSVVVSRRGEIVLEQHLDGEPDALRNTRSCTKTIVGSLLGIAIERGLVPGVDARLTRLFGRETREAEKHAITLRDLLIMSSCLECNDWDDVSAGNEENMYPTTIGSASGSAFRCARRGASATAPRASSVSASRSSARSASRCRTSRSASCSRRLASTGGTGRRHRAASRPPRADSELTSRALHDLGRAHLERPTRSVRLAR